MKHRKTWVGIGIGLLLWLIAGWGVASSPRGLAELRLWIWFPEGLRGWTMLAVVLGSAFIAGGVWSAWKSRVTATTMATRSAPDTASAFSVDPWNDTEPSMPDSLSLPLSERVTLLWNIARALEAQGSLRAAREMYREAYKIARRVPEWAARQDEIALAERKITRRLTLGYSNRRIRSLPWSRLSHAARDEHDKPR